MSTIVITGGAGFIGAHTTKLLAETDPVCDIHIIDNFSQSRKNVLNHPRITYHEVDIRDTQSLTTTFSRIRPETVLHFAALASVPDSVANPAAYFETNVVGSLNLLAAMRTVDCKQIIFSSSAAVYGEPISDVITEDHPTNPTNPYGYTKLVVENILKQYHHAYGVSSISFRYFCAAGNEPTYNLGEFHIPETHAIPVLVQTALGIRDSFSIYGNDYPTKDGTGVRDYIHVDDLARAHILAIPLVQTKNICAQYNLGINKGFSVRELISAVEQVSETKIVAEVKSRRPGDPSRLVANAARAMHELDWEPQYTDITNIVRTAFNAFNKHSQT